MKLQVIVTKETPDAMAYARALERRGARVLLASDRNTLALASPTTPYVLTRPCDPEIYFGAPPTYDVEGLHPANVGRIVSGSNDYVVPAICRAIQDHLDEVEKNNMRHRALDVIGHGLGSVIAAYFASLRNRIIRHYTTKQWIEYAAFAAVLPDPYVINASVAKINGNHKILQLCENPPEFSKRLINIVMERAEVLSG